MTVSKTDSVVLGADDVQIDRRSAVAPFDDPREQERVQRQRTIQASRRAARRQLNWQTV